MPYPMNHLPNKNNQSPHQSLIETITQKPIYVINDYQFFTQLKAYTPFWYDGQGSPFLLKNQSWVSSLTCVMIFNVLYLLAIFTFLIKNGQNGEKVNNQNTLIIIISILVFILINISYFLTQFMNPGIRNLSNIPEQEFKQDGREFCDRCNQYRTKDMSHCRDCQVCVWGLDHHCGFFGKCIAGYQKFAFYAFLTFLFGGFILILVSMSLALKL